MPTDVIGQLTRSGFNAAPADVLERCRRTFLAAHHIRIEGLLEPSLLDRWERSVSGAPFRRRVHHDAAYWGGEPPSDLILDAPDVLGRMLFVFNDPALFRTVERISGCEPIGSFKGIVYRFEHGAGHADRWHSDMTGDRLVAATVNLGRVPHRGGRLQIADAATRAITCEIDTSRFGSAVLFELSESLRHRVSALEPGPPRTVFTGWFVSEPRLEQWLRT